jgi:hypothetical protein
MPQYIDAAGRLGIKLLAFAADPASRDSTVVSQVTACAKDASVNVILPAVQSGDCPGVHSSSPRQQKGGYHYGTGYYNKGSNTTCMATFFISSAGQLLYKRFSILNRSHSRGTDLYIVNMPGVGKVCSLLGDETYNILAR